METITSTLRGLELADPQSFGNLTAYPLVQHGAKPADYLTLGEALGKKMARITELSESGSVPELLLDNRGAANILVLDGEELIGAKQNRIANLTILAAANARTVLPVSCVEQGRWHYDSDEFDTAPRAQFSRGRAEKTAALSSSLRSAGSYAADQNMVWDSIAAKQQRMKVHSPTAAMTDIYEQHHDRVEGYAAAFAAIEDQVGVVLAIDGEVQGMDLFDAPDTLKTMLPKIVRSFAIDALESTKAKQSGHSGAEASRFLDRVAAAETEVYSGVSLGRDVRLSGPLVAGGALIHDQRLIHLAAFTMKSTPEKSGDRLKRAHWWQ